MKKKILIAPLNWGLGHAARCIPIINALLQHNFIPIIASDGAALSLLKKEFPELETVELPSYNISYSKNGYYLKLKLLMDTPKILRAIKQERRAINTIVKNHAIVGIISDNRFGIYHQDIPSVFITHQLKVLSGNTTWLSTALHQKIIRRFDACWVPDYSDTPNLSGTMGHRNKAHPNVTYMGPLSRFQKLTCPFEFEIMVLLSGPEPQRDILERKLLDLFKDYDAKVLFVRGVMENEQTYYTSKNLTIYNYMTTEMLEKSLNASKLIVARSGYTTIMDLAKLGKRAFFIPTPGQPEQRYLAKIMMKNNWAPSCEQKNFSLERLNTVGGYNGFETKDQETNFKELFCLFEGK
ncbi:glycosyltransferase [Gelidibacter salicanalis]|uniref:Glycosyltransferase n=1 Tax=Gelidibacter salicanalis TaxID=291193 RepID=A0A934KSU8_9FLAO|nr:glycosyltransferase [Gelidibacter salicanalis]MBJ7880098.1 glycosyltransferase [Gelidibacter salicanalis]